jgi:hypothetical protein
MGRTARGLRFDSLQVQEVFLNSVQIGFGDRPVSYPIGTGSSFPGEGVKRPKLTISI